MSKLPDGWRSVQLRDLIEIHYGKSSNDIRDEEGVYPIFGTGGIIGYSNKYLCDEPSIIIGRKGTIDSPQITLKPFWATDTTFYCLTINDDDIFWLYHLLITQKLERLDESSSIPSLSRSALYNVKIPVPPLPEQRKIAGILSTWDEAIQLVEALIAALKERKKGLMQRLLTGEVRFPGCDREWENQAIGSILKEVKRRVKIEPDESYNLLSVRRRSEGAFFRETRKGDEITESMYKVHDNDFLISKRQIVHGASALATAEFDGFLVSNAYHTLQPRNGNSIRFFSWLSKTPYLYHLSYISSHGVHIEKLFFVIESYLKHQIATPPSINEQDKIAAMLDSVQDLIDNLVIYAAALREQKKGLMQRLLTGEVRVRV